MLFRLSASWAYFEIRLAATCAVMITILILINVVTRASDMAVFWIDEAAIYTMIWMTFLVASASIHNRSSIRVTIFVDLLQGRWLKAVDVILDGLILFFGLAMTWFCWLWFSPLAFMRTGFDVEVFQQETFNFIYAEPTNTLGFRKAWVWSIMMIFAIGFFVHALSNIICSLHAFISNKSPEDGARETV